MRFFDQSHVCHPQEEVENSSASTVFALSMLATGILGYAVDERGLDPRAMRNAVGALLIFWLGAELILYNLSRDYQSISQLNPYLRGSA